MKRRGFLAAGVAAIGALFLPKGTAGSQREKIKVLSNEESAVDGRPFRVLHLEIPFPKTAVLIDLDNGRRAFAPTGWEKETDPWSNLFFSMWEATEGEGAKAPVDQRYGLFVKMNRPDGYFESMCILPHPVDFSHIRFIAPMECLI